MKQTKFWLKLIGVAFLLHIVLILLSILEVAIYSWLIVRGKDESFYKGHAEISAPWISGIFGSLFIFILVKRFIKKNNGHCLTYTIGFPLIFIYYWTFSCYYPFKSIGRNIFLYLKWLMELK